jgi:hypothetical protein
LFSSEELELYQRLKQRLAPNFHILVTADMLKDIDEKDQEWSLVGSSQLALGLLPDADPDSKDAQLLMGTRLPVPSPTFAEEAPKFMDFNKITALSTSSSSDTLNSGSEALGAATVGLSTATTASRLPTEKRSF